MTSIKKIMKKKRKEKKRKDWMDLKFDEKLFFAVAPVCNE